MTRRTSNVALVLLTVGIWGVALLVPGARYWDDWVIMGDDVVSLYRDVGLPWIGYVAGAVSVVGPVGFKLVAVVCAGIIALAARGIASRGLELDATQTFVVAALVALLPFNVARASVAVLTTYSISLMVFFVAWWLLVASERRSHLRSGTAALLLLFSFTTASLLLFVAVPVAHLALLELDRSRGFWRGLAQFVTRYWYVLATPMVFWIIRTTFLQPSGEYANYNTFVGWSWPASPAMIAAAWMLIALTIGIALLLPRVFQSNSSRFGSVLTGLLGGSGTVAIAVLLWLGRGSTSPGAVVIPLSLSLAGVTVMAVSIAVSRRRADDAGPFRRATFLGATGLVVFALGALPYLLVGKTPSFVDWETRHQLLLPVGTAVLLLSAIVALDGVGRTAAARAAGFLAVGASAVAVLMSGLTLVADWNKQEQVITALSGSDEVRDASTVVVTDETAHWNYGARRLRFYEPVGWMIAAFGDRSRFALSSADAQTGKVAHLYDEGVRYGFSDWDADGPVVGVAIRPLDGASWWDLLVGRDAIEVTPTASSFDPQPQSPTTPPDRK